MAHRRPDRLRDRRHRQGHRRPRGPLLRRARGGGRADPARHRRGHAGWTSSNKVIEVDRELPRAVNVDVFTLFPDWFDFFRGQRHVENAIAGGLEFDTVGYRDTTPLTGGQVDDTPYGGGAGMVIRVDVVEAALEARYGCDAEEVRNRRRVVAFAAGGQAVRRRARRRARRRGGAHVPVRPLRGARRARARGARVRRRLDRPVCRGRRRAAGDGGVRRRDQEAAGRARPRRERARGVVLGRAGGRSRVPALHAAGQLARPRGPRRAALRRPREDQGVAARAEPPRAQRRQS